MIEIHPFHTGGVEGVPNGPQTTPQSPLPNPILSAKQTLRADIPLSPEQIKLGASKLDKSDPDLALKKLSTLIGAPSEVAPEVSDHVENTLRTLFKGKV